MPLHSAEKYPWNAQKYFLLKLSGSLVKNIAFANIITAPNKRSYKSYARLGWIRATVPTVLETAVRQYEWKLFFSPAGIIKMRLKITFEINNPQVLYGHFCAKYHTKCGYY